MNSRRRSEISKIRSRLEDARLDVDNITNDEQMCFDSLPENFQEAERGERMQNAIDALEEASGLIEEAICKLTEATD